MYLTNLDFYYNLSSVREVKGKRKQIIGSSSFRALFGLYLKQIMRSPIVFDDIHFEWREYDPQAAYAQSKTADSLFAVEATRRWAADGIVANAVNPGGVATGLQRDFTQKQKDYLAAAEASGVFVYKTVEQGAATTLVAAVAPEFAHTGGHYLTDGREAHTVPNDADLFENGDGVKLWAIDPDTAQKLWTISLELIGQPATQIMDAS
jgi:hypothetical protein